MTWTKILDKNRASGMIVKDDKVLLIHRLRDGRDYWVFPGGSIEEGESVEEALDREMTEELGIKVHEKELLFEIENAGRTEYCFLIKDYSGNPQIGGPELERMNEQNQYLLEEKSMAELHKINLLPKGATSRLQGVVPKP